MATTHKAALHHSLSHHLNENRKRNLEREAATAASLAAAFQHARVTLARAQAALLAAYTAEQQRLQAQQDAEAEADDEDPDDLPAAKVSSSWLASSPEARRYLRQVAIVMASFALASQFAIADGQRTATHAGAEDMAALLAAAGLTNGVQRATLASLSTLIGRSASTGKSLAALLDGLGDAIAARAYRALLTVLSMVEPASLDSIMRQLADVLGTGYRRALTVERTELMGAYRGATTETMRANSAVVEGWIWVASASACVFCQEQHGSFHTLDEDMVTHVNCGCQQEPVVAPQPELLDLFGTAAE